MSSTLDDHNAFRQRRFARRLDYLEKFHDRMSDADRQYIAGIGFDVKYGPPPKGKTLAGRLHMVLSKDRPMELRFNDYFADSTLTCVDLTKRTLTSLAGQIEEMVLRARSLNGTPNCYSNPPGTPVLVYVIGPEWKPVADELLRRYPRTP